MRKSTLGTHGVRPVRLDGHRSPSMLGSGSSPTPLRLCLGKTPHSRRKLGSSRKKNQAVRVNSALYSSLCPVPKTRRCLYYREENKKEKINCPSSSTPNTLKGGLLKKDNIPSTKLNASNLKVKESRLPRPGSLVLKTNSKSRRSSGKIEWAVEAQVHATDTTKSDPKRKKNNQFNFSQETEYLVKEQEKTLKKMFDEARESFTQILQEKVTMISDMLEDHKRLIEDCKKTFLDNLFLFKNPTETTCDNTKGQDHTKRSSRKSLKEYTDLRTQFQCLKTPTLSSRKAKAPKTPRSLLSTRVQAQLEGLFDD